MLKSRLAFVQDHSGKEGLQRVLDALPEADQRTRQGHPDPLIKTLDFPQEYAARVDFSDYDRALAVLRETGAFEEPGPKVRLRLP